MTKLSKCEACQRVVADAHFMLRRRVTPAHALSSIEATDALESLCSDAYRRYDDSPRLVEKVCEDVMEEHVMKLLKVRSLWWGLLVIALMTTMMFFVMTMIAFPSPAVFLPPASPDPHFQAAQAAELPDLHAACSGQTCATRATRVCREYVS